MADDLAVQAVDAINDLSGVHPGHRAAHAKGSLLTGTFQATPEAAGLTPAPHMPGDPVRAPGEAPGQLRHLRVQLDPLLPLRRRRWRGPLRAFPLGAGGRRAVA